MAEYNVQINKYNANNLGYDQLYPQPMKHANTHLLNGSDPINVGELGVSNRNLLDNWYFAAPIDQRGGYVVPPGTEYFKLNTSTVAGTTSSYVKVDYFNSNGLPVITVGGTQYNTNASAAVHGYTGAGYGIDRWKVDGTLLIQDGCIVVKNTSTPIIRQFLDNPNSYRGKVLIFSVQVKSALSNLVLYIRYNNYINAAIKGFNNIPAGGVITITATVPDIDLTALFVQCSSDVVTEFSLQAAKFELGTVQTLAHQDEDGNLVLNDPPPDKGMELLKCQRYMLPLDNLARYRAITITDNAIDFFIPTPSTMRAVPSIAFESTSNPSPTVYNWSTGASQQGFAWSVIAKSSNGVYVRGTKTAHGLSDARVNFPVESYLIANL